MRAAGGSQANDFQAGTVYPLTVKVHQALEGAWVSVEVFRAGKQVTAEFKGFDPDEKKWMHLVVTRYGSSATLSSPGWEGNHMTSVTADGNDRAIFTKLSDTEYTHRNETKVGGVFKPVFEKHCKKVVTR